MGPDPVQQEWTSRFEDDPAAIYMLDRIFVWCIVMRPGTGSHCRTAGRLSSFESGRSGAVSCRARLFPSYAFIKPCLLVS